MRSTFSMPLNLAIIYGSVRTERQGYLGRWINAEHCHTRGQTATLIDPLLRRLPLSEKCIRNSSLGQAPQTLQRMAEKGLRDDSGQYCRTSISNDRQFSACAWPNGGLTGLYLIFVATGMLCHS